MERFGVKLLRADGAQILAPPAKSAFQCAICGFPATSKQALASHARWRHPGPASATAGVLNFDAKVEAYLGRAVSSGTIS